MADPNLVSNKGYTPLYITSQNGLFEATNLLLKNDANPNIQDVNFYLFYLLILLDSFLYMLHLKMVILKL